MLQNAYRQDPANAGWYCHESNTKNRCVDNFFALNKLFTDQNKPLLNWAVTMPSRINGSSMEVFGKESTTFKRLSVLLALLNESMLNSLLSIKEPK